MKHVYFLGMIIMVIFVLLAIPTNPAKAADPPPCPHYLEVNGAGIVLVPRLFVRSSSDNHPSDNIVGYIFIGDTVTVMDNTCSWGWSMVRIKKYNVTKWVETYEPNKKDAYWIAENDGKTSFLISVNDRYFYKESCVCQKCPCPFDPGIYQYQNPWLYRNPYRSPEEGLRPYPYHWWEYDPYTYPYATPGPHPKPDPRPK